MISTESQPSVASRARNALVLASSDRAASMIASLPSPCFADSAVLSPSRRTFFCRSKAWLRTTGPKIRAPPRNCGERRLPWRAWPVPFWLYGFLVVPLMSEMPLVLWVPARRLASCQSTTRASMSMRGASPNTSSARSIVPTSSALRFLTLICMLVGPRRGRCRGRRRRFERRRIGYVLGARPLGGVADQHIAALGARHRAVDHQEAAHRVGRDHLQVLRGDPLDAEMAGHLLVLEHLARILAVAG